MKNTAYDLMLFYICLNLGMYIVMGLGTLPTSTQPSSTATQMSDTVNNAFLGIMNNTLTSLIAGGAGLIAMIGILTGHNWLGFGFVSIAALIWFSPVVLMVFNGLATGSSLWASLGVPQMMITVIGILNGFILLVFIIEFAGQRDMT